MSDLTPAETAVKAVESGTAKAHLPLSKMLVSGFLAGAYIAVASLLAIVTTAGLRPEIWGNLPTLITGVVFSLGLILVVVAGAELLTGNMALVPMAVLDRRVTIGRMSVNFAVLVAANFVGSVVVAYFLAVKTGVIGSAGGPATTPAGLNFTRLATFASAKALTESDYQIFLRATGCNWLVCLAVWMALSAKQVGGKIAAIIFPITAFVALGFDHVVANMFFLPAAVFAHVPGVTWAHTINNLIFAFVGNLLGAGVFVGGAYWFIYRRNAPAAPAVASSPSAGSLAPSEPAQAPGAASGGAAAGADGEGSGADGRLGATRQPAAPAR